LDPNTVETNIVLVRVLAPPARMLAQQLEAAGVRVFATGLDTIRAVTNLNVTAEDIERAVEIIGNVVKGARST
jgi:threonine aldolase